jgi:hypothetical protein
MSSITVEQYSEKAIVVRGNTIPYKEKLLSAGGKWNKLLKGGEGWIFPLTKKPFVEKLLSEPPTVHEDGNSSSSSSSSRIRDEGPSSSDSSYKSKQNTYKTSRSVSNESSSEVVLTKKEYLHLISRIERLEQLVAKFSDNNHESENEPKKIQKKSKKNNIPPPLSSISDADLCDSVNYDDLECESDSEREPVKRLLRNKKNNL